MQKWSIVCESLKKNATFAEYRHFFKLYIFNYLNLIA